MIIITIFITTSTILIIVAILLIFIGVEYQLSHARPVFCSSSWRYFSFLLFSFLLLYMQQIQQSWN